MLLNLSDALSEPYRVIEQDVPVEMEIFRSQIGTYAVKDKGKLPH